MNQEFPIHATGVPDACLSPRNTRAGPMAYDTAAEKLVKPFRVNDSRFDISAEVRGAGPKA